MLDQMAYLNRAASWGGKQVLAVFLSTHFSGTTQTGRGSSIVKVDSEWHEHTSFGGRARVLPVPALFSLHPCSQNSKLKRAPIFP